MKYIERTFLFRFYSNCTNADQLLLLCGFFSAGLMVVRVLYTGSLLFAFLVWNLLLAFIPYAVSKRMDAAANSKNKKAVVLLFILWLLFIPNAFYIITDLFHLGMNQDLPLWYDLALLLSFAWSGLLLGIVSVREMEKWFGAHVYKNADVFFILPVMALNGLGIYVGRYLRYNSWDVLTDPFQLTRDIIYLFVHPLRSRFDWSMILCYTVLLTVIYLTLKKMSKVFQ